MIITVTSQNIYKGFSKSSPYPIRSTIALIRDFLILQRCPEILNKICVLTVHN